ncbi:MAG TPA: sensor histidine kinase, partial [Epulopiscium sp.]|nr:sensor histidine kinase [Candidatus Epulonipiscium sp.]
MVLENNRLAIKDKGDGIEEAYLPYIFDRFYKSRSEQNKVGTGLGL